MKKVSFKNDLGQTINVGDSVVCIATGFGRNLTIRAATFVGTTNNQPTVVYTHNKGTFDYKKNKWNYKIVSKKTTLRSGRVYLSPFSDTDLAKPQR